MSVLSELCDKLIVQHFCELLGDESRAYHLTEYVEWSPTSAAWARAELLYGVTREDLDALTPRLLEIGTTLEESFVDAATRAISDLKRRGVSVAEIEVPDLGIPVLQHPRFLGLDVRRRRDQKFRLRVLSHPQYGRFVDMPIVWSTSCPK